MRIIAGRFKGITLKAPRHIRPTESKVRSSLFDILGSSVVGASFLDLFAGSGGVGFEAISRGAKQVVFVERDRLALEALRDNLNSIISKSEAKRESTTKIELINSDVFQALRKLIAKARRFDIVFLDPPYQMDIVKKSLQSLGQCDILTPLAIVVVQAFKKYKVEESVGVLRLYRKVKYGDTALFFYKRS